MGVWWLLLRKEWDDVFRNRIVLFSVVITPLLLVGVAAGSLLPIRGLQPGTGPGDPAEIRALFGALCEALPSADCLAMYLVSMMMPVFLVLPTALPSAIAAYAIVGEKTERTLEPLLATPITTVQLLGSKCLAAVIPAVGVTWAAATLYLGLVALMVSPRLAASVASPAWIAALVFLVPLLAGLSVLLATIVSSRSTDPRSAQQVAALVAVPVVGVIVAQSLGVMVVRPLVVIPAIAGLAAVDAVLAGVAVRLFERESILTRWTGL
ncbi:MAG: ABC transporter permease subunit [Myxococcota bacterium]